VVSVLYFWYLATNASAENIILGKYLPLEIFPFFFNNLFTIFQDLKNIFDIGFGRRPHGH